MKNECCAHKIEFGPFAEVLDRATEKMVGEVLTILEAVIPGERQVEATKVSVKQAVWRFNRNLKTNLEEKILQGDE